MIRIRRQEMKSDRDGDNPLRAFGENDAIFAVVHIQWRQHCRRFAARDSEFTRRIGLQDLLNQRFHIPTIHASGLLPARGRHRFSRVGQSG
jgi:hypothetical protein